MVTDVHQGGSGDCWLMATLGEVAYNDPGMIQSMFTANGNGTYTVRLYESQTANPGSPSYVTVNNKLPDGGHLYDSPYDGNAYCVLWAALAEKAYAELRFGDYSYSDLSGSSPTHPLAVITGRPTQDVGWAKTTPPPTYSFDSDAEAALSQHQFMILGTAGGPAAPLVDSHAYALLACSNGQFLLFNPWGVGQITFLSAAVSTTGTQYVSVSGGFPGGINKGDVIQIDGELMLVQSATKDAMMRTTR